MNPTFNPAPRKTCRKPFHPSRLDRQPETQRPNAPADNIQLIYAHLPPATIMATEQHLRTQTRIEQRAQQLWFVGKNRSEDALNHWLRAEQEVVQELCAALRPLHPGQPDQPESTSSGY